MSLWRSDYLADFDNLEQIIRMLSPGDPEAQERWRSDYTLTEVVQAFCERTMFNH